MNVDTDGLRPIPQPERVLPEGVTTRYEDGALRLSLAITIYPIDGILRACYWLTERGFFYVAPLREGFAQVTLLSKTGARADTDQLVWDFLADLVDQCLRLKINAETHAVRELIVAQAFAEVDIIDDRGEAPHAEEGLQADSRGVGRWRTVS